MKEASPVCCHAKQLTRDGLIARRKAAVGKSTNPGPRPMVENDGKHSFGIREQHFPEDSLLPM